MILWTADDYQAIVDRGLEKQAEGVRDLIIRTRLHMEFPSITDEQVERVMALDPARRK